MAHLRKKIHRAIYDNFGSGISIEKQNIIGISSFIISYKNKKSFLYVYNNSINLKCNLEIIFSLIKYYFGFCEILNCKQCIRYKHYKDYQKCKRKCFYSIYCRKKEIYE